MKARLIVFAAVWGAAVFSHLGAVQGQAQKTVWDGVYTEAQAGRGATVFSDKCAKCHATDLGGGDAPALVGKEFAVDWDGLTMAQLFERVFTSMPQDAPRSLSRPEAAAVIAYVLQKNAFPAGQTELTDQLDALQQIKYVATKP